VDTLKLNISGNQTVPGSRPHQTIMRDDEVRTAARTAHAHGKRIAAHVRAAASIKLALESEIDLLYHCEYADEECLDLLEAARDRIFVAPAVGLLHNTIFEAQAWGITYEKAKQNGVVGQFECAQHVFADGTRDTRWPKDGIPVSTAPNGQYDFDMAEDGSGGGLLMWDDDRANFSQVFGQRLLVDGSVAPGWVPNGTQVSNSIISKFEPRIAADGLGGFYGVWVENTSSESLPIVGQHMRGDGTFEPSWTAAGAVLASDSPNGSCDLPVITSDRFGGALLAYERSHAPSVRIYAERIQNDGPVPTLLSLADYDTGPGRVTLRWQATNAADIRGSVERSTDDASWMTLGTPRLEGTDLLAYDDLGVAPGRYWYRLAYSTGAMQQFSDPVVVDVPAVAQLALGGFRPNPAVSNSAIAFSLPDTQPSRLEVVDVRGRMMLSREVGTLGPGTHNVSLSEAGRLGPGVYWVRLVRPETTLTRKGVVVG